MFLLRTKIVNIIVNMYIHKYNIFTDTESTGYMYFIYVYMYMYYIVVVKSLSCVQPFATP